MATTHVSSTYISLLRDLQKIVRRRSILKFIIPHDALEQQASHTTRTERLDTEWQHLQLIEASLLRALDQDLDVEQHDLVFYYLDGVRQRMTDIQLEMERGPDWAIDEFGGDHDKR